VARSIFFYTDSRVLGGAENAMFMLLAGLDRGAWEATLLLEEGAGTEPLRERAAALGVPVLDVAPMPLGLAGARRLSGLRKMLRSHGPDVFHAHMSSPVACKWGLSAAVAARVPAVLGTVQVIADHTLDRSTMLQLRLLARGVDRYLAVSAAIAAELAGGYGWPAEKIAVVHNAVELERFGGPAPPGLRAELGAAEAPLVLTAARLSDQKGHPVLLEAAARLPEAIFALAGEGPEEAALRRLAERLGVADHVRFLGRRDDVPTLLAACDVFALPSLYEGSSLALLEAMAARRAVVASAIPGTDELVEDGRTGLLVPPGDPDALAGALARLLGDPGLRELLAAAGRERVERDFGSTAAASRVAAIYSEVLGDG
jgi:glycosyltransferase involved in cell wall biosynthesis